MELLIRCQNTPLVHHQRLLRWYVTLHSQLYPWNLPLWLPQRWRQITFQDLQCSSSLHWWTASLGSHICILSGVISCLVLTDAPWILLLKWIHQDYFLSWGHIHCHGISIQILHFLLAQKNSSFCKLSSQIIEWLGRFQKRSKSSLRIYPNV